MKKKKPTQNNKKPQTKSHEKSHLVYLKLEKKKLQIIFFTNLMQTLKNFSREKRFQKM